ncbi:NAD(P)H-binding protein [Bradyrhizobium sp.]|uniref:SDR family oxidoreductase n=1 Tax=Bradyrhizobium sp. TaxID=376 RepID=UPI00239565B1|nr:NAD(P)H-binding protein [Bradyrhizobium sp.]MDE2379477.1 NAD(P)H-binding protein [Bradyrhizobium sp.]
MSVILVTGGTGHLGRDIVDRLVKSGRRVRILARSAQSRANVEWATGDLATGAGVADSLRNVHTVINAATFSPIARRGGIRLVDFFSSPAAVDVDGTRRLLALCQEASVAHFVHVSIVGLHDASLPYARVKLAGEQLVRGSTLSWSVIPAMPFYYLLDKLLAGLLRIPVWPVPRTVFNPVDTSDVADYVIRCAFDGEHGDRAEIGGPDELSCVEFARQYLSVRGLRRAVLPIALSDRAARGMGFVVSDGVRGSLCWRDWLRRQYLDHRQAA